MKHSTFYTDSKKRKRVYTTIKNTPMHTHLRKEFKGRTFRHSESAKLYFIYPTMPLDEPIGVSVEIDHEIY